jgi:hypothetical protein
LTQSSSRPAGWQVLLALLSLALCVLLWISGLLESLERPSVSQSLSVRQLQLALQAAPALPEDLRALVISRELPAELAEQLEQQRAQDSGPGTPDQLLQLLLLQRLKGSQPLSAPLLEELSAQVSPEQRPLLRWLQPDPQQPVGERGDAQLVELMAAWTPGLSPLTRQLLCEAVDGGGGPVLGSGGRVDGRGGQRPPGQASHRPRPGRPR